MTKGCEECGRSYHAMKSNQKYCCNHCRYEGRKNVYTKNGQICKFCGGKFFVNKERKFCSHWCYLQAPETKEANSKSLKRAIEAYKFRCLIRQKKRYCKHCGTVYRVIENRKKSNQYYCSQECYWKDVKGLYKESLRKGHETIKKKPKKMRTCVNCGEKYSVNRHAEFYCSQKCYSEIRRNAPRDEKGRFMVESNHG